MLGGGAEAPVEFSLGAVGLGQRVQELRPRLQPGALRVEHVQEAELAELEAAARGGVGLACAGQHLAAQCLDFVGPGPQFVGGGQHLGPQPLRFGLGALLGRLPALVVIIMATTSFGLSGFIIQEVMVRTFGFALQPGIASVPAAIATLFSMHHVGHWLGRLMPREQTEAVSTSEFIGRVATVFRGTATTGQPAEAKLTDIHGKTHYVLVEPEEADLTLTEGSEVVLIRQKGPVYQAIIRLKPVD